jgi:Predicted integral membrane protein
MVRFGNATFPKQLEWNAISTWSLATTRVLISTFAVCLLPTVAKAGLSFCNRTDANVNVSIAYVERDAPGTSTGGDMAVTAEGWWGIAPNECAEVSGINVGNYWAYFYAHQHGRAWGGKAFLCVPSKKFTIGARFGRPGDQCPAGQRLIGFNRINVSTRNYTLTLNP